MSYVPPAINESENRACRSTCGTEDASPLDAGSLSTRTLQPDDNKGGNADDSRTKFKEWLLESAWPGMGLFGESYLLFSVGTLKPIWTMLYPDCFAGSSYGSDGAEGGNDNYGGELNDDGVRVSAVCADALLNSITFSVVLGVILGMFSLGIIANKIGRRVGCILTASLMAFGAVGMALVSLTLEDTPAALFGCMSALLFVFGIGEPQCIDCRDT